METLEVWDGSVAESFDGGDGSAENPYQIADGAQLAKLALDTNSGVDFSSKHFVLTSDILLNDISLWNFTSGANSNLAQSWKRWIVIGRPSGNTNIPFTGSFDGDDHIIWGLYNDYIYSNAYAPGSPSGAVGLFGMLRGTISNTTVACGLLAPISVSVGAIVGQIEKGSVDNCHVLQVDVKPTYAEKIGGICGSFINNDGIEATNCSFEGLIAYDTYNNIAQNTIAVGGIVGNGEAYESAGLVSKCYSKCDLSVLDAIVTLPDGEYYSSHIYAGGICGTGDIVDSCYGINNIVVSANTQTDESFEGDLSVSIGGVAGRCNTSIINCGSSGSSEYSGNIDNIYVGGIAGILGNNERPMDGWGHWYQVDATFCYSDVVMKINSIAGTEKMGGISGCAGGEITITNCYYNKGHSDRAVAHTVPQSAVFTDQIKGLSDDELCDGSNYYNWDFDFMWMTDDKLNNGLPMLQSLIEYY